MPPPGLIRVNVQADKGTTVHNTRQFTTVTAVIPKAESLLNVVYLGQPLVKIAKVVANLRCFTGNLGCVHRKPDKLKSLAD